MALITANDFAQQMVAQARVQDPSFSGEVGTPERKIIDAVAQSLADNQVDLTGLQSALDIDSKFGSNLDQFTALFGMQRQQSAPATGYVTFSRFTPATSTITIPANVILQATVSSTTEGPVQFVTTASGSIAVNQTISGAIPIQCISAGEIGNVAANSITRMVGQLVVGVTSVTNPNALTNGISQEDDNSYKVRFKNTWARNLAGTEDQYLALAVAGTFTTKAVVVGPQARYQEYIQVPSFDDAGYVGGTQTTALNTFGTQNQWTSALSTIPYAKQIYTTTATFLSNSQQGPVEYFYRPGNDYQFNYPAISAGDTLRNAPSTTLSSGVTLPAATIPVVSTGRPTTGPVTNPFPTSGTLNIGGQTVTYTGVTAVTFTGCTGGTGTIASGTPVYSVTSATQPNFTFLNVYNPVAGATPIAGIQAVSPGSVLLSEYSYVSNASRNDIVHNVTNCVDIYVNGTNPVRTSMVTLPNAITSAFNNNPNSPWYYENYRRDGQPAKRPQLNNYFTPLFQTPLTSLPPSITLNNVTFSQGIDYWLIHETDSLSGSIRARDGIEWNANSSPGNNIATASAPGINPVIPLEVDNYSFDANVPALQTSMEAARQVTTDVLVHSAKTRYFKLDITVMYSPNVNYSVTNAGISATLQAYFDNQYFGTVIQLSDLLEIVHEVGGVDNVRWSNDLPTIPDLIRVYETDVNGNPLHGVSVDRLVNGAAAVKEQQTLYVVGNPSGINNNVADSFTLSWSILLPAPATPVPTTATTGGTIAAGVYTVGTTYVNANGETTASTATVTTTGTTSTITIPSPPASANATGWYAYVSQAGGTGMTRQQTAGSPTALGTNLTLTAPPTSTGGVPPIVNSAAYTMTTAAIPFLHVTDGSPVTTADIQSAIRAIQPVSGIYNNIVVTQDTRPITNVTQPILSFTITYGANGAATIPTVTNTVTASQYAFDGDFFLRDNELPSLPTGQVTGDVLPGLIIRTRAQNTFARPGLF